MKNKIIMILAILLIMPINVSATTKKIESDVVTLSKCVDGDTARFIKGDTEIKVRFLAIDTPETVHPAKEVELYGKDASEYTCKLLTDAKVIKLEYDPKSAQIDKYGRYLAWIFIDGELLQKSLIEIGYAKVAYLYGNYMYTESLQEVEANAKENKIGMWSNEAQEIVNTVNTDADENAVVSSEPDDIISQLLNFLGEIFAKILEFIEGLIDDML